MRWMQGQFVPTRFKTVESELFTEWPALAFKLYVILRRFVWRRRDGYLGGHYQRGFLCVEGYLAQWAQRLGKSPSTVSRQLAWMEEKGIIRCLQDARTIGGDRPNIYALGEVYDVPGGTDEDAIELYYCDYIQSPKDKPFVEYDLELGPLAIEVDSDGQLPLIPRGPLAPVKEVLQEVVEEVLQGSNREENREDNIIPAAFADGEGGGNDERLQPQAGQGTDRAGEDEPVGGTERSPCQPEVVPSDANGREAEGGPIPVVRPREDQDAGDLRQGTGGEDRSPGRSASRTRDVGQLLARVYGSRDNDNGDQEPAQELERVLQHAFGMKGKRMAAGQRKRLGQPVTVGDPDRPATLKELPCPAILYDTEPEFAAYVQEGIDWANGDNFGKPMTLAARRNACIGWIRNYEREPNGWLKRQSAGEYRDAIVGVTQGAEYGDVDVIRGSLYG